MNIKQNAVGADTPSHTPGPLVDDLRGHGVITDSKKHTVCVANKAEDARRIVACVNACANYPTDLLESCNDISAAAIELRQQRDELLAALREIACSANGFSTDYEGIARAAIAKQEAI